MNEDNEKWTTIKKKIRKVKPPRPQIPIKIKVTYRPLCEKDCKLSDKEKLILKESNFQGMCNCCDASEISEIIGRKIYPCYRCYCCSGDEPCGDCEIMVGSDGSILMRDREDPEPDYYYCY
jgi:hypothetical protein